MKKLVLLVFALNICLGTFAQFTPGDTLKYRISLKDKAATFSAIFSRHSAGVQPSFNLKMRYTRKAFMCLLQENGIISSLFPVMTVC